jgi:uncharacterized protein
MLELVQNNLLSPVVLAFVLGMIATLVRSDLRFPEELYVALSIYLLLAIGLKGGVELSKTTLAEIWAPIAVTIFMGVATPVAAYAILRRLGGFNTPDSAAIAAHYGSVSVVTFLAATAFLNAAGVTYEMYMPALVAILEIPAIVVALLLARMRMGGTTAWGEVFHEILSGRSILLLLGGPQGFESVSGFFVVPFHGILMLFLLEMGMVTARRLRDLRKVGLFLIAFGILVPILHGAIGIALGKFVGMSMGGSMMLGVLVASASYIAAPAAVRIALPEANPSYYLTASLGITFPFNLTVGIPLYFALAKMLFE